MTIEGFFKNRRIVFEKISERIQTFDNDIAERNLRMSPRQERDILPLSEPFFSDKLSC